MMSETRHKHVLATQVALLRARQRYGIRRAITFHTRVADAREFARTLPRTVARLDPTGAADSLTARTSTEKLTCGQRHTVLDALRTPPAGGWAVISNARCLDEGVDIPTVDAVAFSQPKQSPVDIMQAIGRALRRTSADAGGHGDAGEVATIVVPIVVDDQPGATHDLDPGDYRMLGGRTDTARARRRVGHRTGHAARGKQGGRPTCRVPELDYEL